MTRSEAVAHWQKGAKDALELAELAHGAGKYALALFNCHLAVEKALKASFIDQCKKDPPTTHNLLQIADLLGRSWTEDQKNMLDTLSDLAVLARYGDQSWETSEATKSTSALWLSQAKEFLALLLP